MKLAIQTTVVLFVAFSVAGCAKVVHNGVANSPPVDSLVQNGTAFDTAYLDVGDCDTIIVPSRSRLLENPDQSGIEIELAKTLHFTGHPSNRLSIDEVRKSMGYAWRIDGRKLRLATFGEFDSGGDGGQWIELSIAITAGLRVERDDSMEMPRSSKRDVGVSRLRKHNENGVICYVSRESSEQWIPLPDKPNANPP